MAADDSEAEPCDVLVVDDQLFHREMVSEMLRAKGFRVSTVGSGDEAITRYANLEQKPLVLMDNIMPKMTGVEATAAIRSIDPTARVIFVSSDTAHREDAIAAGAMGFISKPFKIAEVFAAVRWALSQPPPGTPAAGDAAPA
ncbi:MAG TPA: response regulator [Candidatus Thermoplasmatota archaeon]|nr:response regulator [Candidatus Thermoplasmatota archaeon]